jgi:hypothetical protein
MDPSSRPLQHHIRARSRPTTFRGPSAKPSGPAPRTTEPAPNLRHPTRPPATSGRGSDHEAAQRC